MTWGTAFKRHKILYSIGAIILLLVAAGAGGIFYLERYGLRDVAMNRGSAALGRTLSIEKLDLAWHWGSPEVRIRNIRIANTQDAADPDLFSASKIDFRVKVWPLLIGRMEFPEFTMVDPKIVLEKKDESTKNWDLPVFSKGSVATEAVVPDSRYEFPVIGSLQVENGSLIYRDIPKKMYLSLKLDTAAGSGGDGGKRLTMTGDGTLQDKKFVLKATGGSIDMLRDSSKDYPLDLHIAMGPTEINLEGTFRDPVKMSGIDAALDIKGHNLADLFYLTGIPLPPTPPYTLAGQLMKKGDVWSYNEFNGKVGDSDLKGNLGYDISGERGLVKIDLKSNLMDMDDLGGFIGLAPSTQKGETAAPEQKVQAQKQAASERALPDVPINLDRLRATDMDVTLNAARLNAPGWPINRLTTHIVLKEGVLTFDPLDMGMAQGVIDGRLVLDGSKDIPKVTSDLVMKRLSLRDFFGDNRFEDLAGGRFGGRIQLTGNGKSLADVLASSNGRVTFLMAGGKISLLIIEAAGMDIAEAAPLLLDRDRSTHVRCAVGDFKVTNGILNSETFFFDTNDTNVAGKAQINLKNEAMDIKVEAHPKDGSILAARTPLTIQGTMKDPAIGIEPAGLAGKGAAAAVLGAFLTPVAAIIPFIELGLGEDSDCKGLIAQAKAKSGAPVPANSTN